MKYSLEFTSQLSATSSEAWDWITSFDGISREMKPYMRMSRPSGVNSLQDIAFEPGQRLFRSWIYLFGFVPFDFSDLTLIRVDEGLGFVEQSNMGSMRFWRHERRLIPNIDGCVIIDTLEFEPKLLGALVYRIVQSFFRHRHRQLKKYLG
jgi:ligand-binding SRPBCC domain-containing protein